MIMIIKGPLLRCSSNCRRR